MKKAQLELLVKISPSREPSQPVRVVFLLQSGDSHKHCKWMNVSASSRVGFIARGRCVSFRSKIAQNFWRTRANKTFAHAWNFHSDWRQFAWCLHGDFWLRLREDPFKPFSAFRFSVWNKSQSKIQFNEKIFLLLHCLQCAWEFHPRAHTEPIIIWKCVKNISRGARWKFFFVIFRRGEVKFNKFSAFLLFFLLLLLQINFNIFLHKKVVTRNWLLADGEWEKVLCEMEKKNATELSFWKLSFLEYYGSLWIAISHLLWSGMKIYIRANIRFHSDTFGRVQNGLRNKLWMVCGMWINFLASSSCSLLLS